MPHVHENGGQNRELHVLHILCRVSSMKTSTSHLDVMEPYLRWDEAFQIFKVFSMNAFGAFDFTLYGRERVRIHMIISHHGSALTYCTFDGWYLLKSYSHEELHIW